MAQGSGPGEGAEADAARSEAFLGVPYAIRGRRPRVRIGAAGTLKPCDDIEDLRALGAGHPPRYDGGARQEECKHDANGGFFGGKRES